MKVTDVKICTDEAIDEDEEDRQYLAIKMDNGVTYFITSEAIPTLAEIGGTL